MVKAAVKDDVVRVKLFGEAMESTEAKEGKRCCRCLERKPFSEFYKRTKSSDGLMPWCKDCDKRKKLLYRLKKKHVLQEKPCRICGEVKAAEQFSKNCYSRDGLRSECKQCCSRIYHKRLLLTPNMPDHKVCSQCGLVKRNEDFYRAKDRRDGLAPRCKTCMRLNRRVYYIVKEVSKSEQPSNRRGIDSWDQVDSVLREMAETQVSINRERATCDKHVRMVKEDTAEKIKVHLCRQARLQLMIEDFIKCVRRTAEKIQRQFAFGSLEFVRGRMYVNLNTALAIRRVGKP